MLPEISFPRQDLSPRAFDAIANIVLHGTFLHDQCLRQALDRDKRKASVLSILTTGCGRAAVRGALGDVQGRRRGDDPEPRRRMGRHGIRLNAIAPGPSPPRVRGRGSIP